MSQTVILVGNVGKDPESRTTAKGYGIVNFPLGVSVRKDETTWWDCAIPLTKMDQFKGVLPYCAKGAFLQVIGEMMVPSPYIAKDGQAKCTRKIFVTSIRILKGVQAETAHASFIEQNKNGQGQSFAADEELPF